MKLERRWLMCRLLIVLAGTGLLSTVSHAADWEFSTDISTGVEYTDNFFFTPSDKTSDFFWRFIPAFQMTGESPTNRTVIDAGVSLERYNAVKRANREDLFGSFNWEHYWEQDTVGVEARFWQESTRTSELETTGQTNVFGTRDNTRFNAYWNTILNETNTLSINGEFLDVKYDLPNLFDYHNYRLLVNWAHQASEVSQFYLNLDGRRYDSEIIGLDYDYGMVLIGYNYMTSELFSFDLSLGGGYGTREVGENYTTFLFNAQFMSQWEYDYLAIGFQSDFAPTSQGELRQIYSLDLNYQHDFTLDLLFSFTARLSEAFPVGEEETERTENLSLRPRFDYQISEEWAFQTWYQYRIFKNTGREAVPTNSVYIGVQYQYN